MFIYDFSIFLTSTAFVDTSARYGIPLSEVCRIFIKLSFRVTLYCFVLFLSNPKDWYVISPQVSM